MTSPKAPTRKKVLMSIYKRMPIGNKHLSAGQHMIMFTGTWATQYGVDNYTTITLESLSDDELARVAAVILGS